MQRKNSLKNIILIFYCAKYILIILSLSIFGCTVSSLPPEVGLVEKQDQDLWRVKANVYAPDEYSRYKIAIQKGKDDIIRENIHFVLFRDYKVIRTEFKDILKQGDEILKEVQKQKEIKSSRIANQLIFLKNKIETIKELTLEINEGRLARKDLIKAELLLAETDLLYKRGEFEAAEGRFATINTFIQSAEEAISPVINRYTDKAQIKKWRDLVEETVAESRDKRIIVIIISKVDKTLIIYRNGDIYRTYTVGIGRNGSYDKLHAGDNATPEGKYHIIKKAPKSRYYKALLINYPNAEDKRQFLKARKKGLVQSKVGIGGLIEIHGGEKDSMTYGCISMDNNRMDEVFSMVDVGTPVTIVGTFEYENAISSAVKKFQ